MRNFNEKLKLSAKDEDLITQSLGETGYISEVIQSLKGVGSGIRIMTWIGVFVFSAVLFFSIWKFFHAETVREQILFATLAIMANSAQIALKLWFCLLYTSPSPRDRTRSRMPSSA